MSSTKFTTSWICVTALAIQAHSTITRGEQPTSPSTSDAAPQPRVFKQGPGDEVTSKPLEKENEPILDLDLQGQFLYSHYNFTDLKKPYDGVDGFLVAKLSLWADAAQTFGPYAEIIPVTTTEDEFWWQRNAQAGGGFQFYPLKNLKESPDTWRAVRLFALAAGRGYYDEPDDANPVTWDTQLGLDYYYDNLFTSDHILYFVFTNASFRFTNFSLEDYQGFIWSGNVKVGPPLHVGSATFVGYGVVDWTWSPQHTDRWWENFTRVGGGVAVYPWANKPPSGVSDGFFLDLLRRFHIFAEVVHNVAWLGDDPPTSVEETDIRVGLKLSTSGFYAGE